MKDEIQRNIYLNPPTEIQEFAGKKTTTQHLNMTNTGQGANWNWGLIYTENKWANWQDTSEQNTQPNQKPWWQIGQGTKDDRTN